MARSDFFFFIITKIRPHDAALNLRGLKSHDHETWHVGPLSDVDVHGLSGILIFGRVAPQARLGLIFLFPLNLGDLKSRGHETWHVGPLKDGELHGLCGILIFGRVVPQAHAFGVFPLYYQ